jgi:hypothetical protein
MEVISLIEKAGIVTRERHSRAGRIDRNDKCSGDGGEECGEAEDEACVQHLEVL